MTTHLKLLSLICGAGIGFGGGTPWILKNLKSSSKTTEIKKIPDSSLESSEDSSNITPEKDKRVTNIQNQRYKEIGNCVVLDNSEEIIDILWHFYQLGDDYITVSCKDTNLTTGVKISDWTGIFPTDLIANGWLLKEGNRFNITTNTKRLDSDDYQTIFDGNRILSPIIGEWGNAITTNKGKSVTVVKVTDDEPQSIYLLFNGKSANNNK